MTEADFHFSADTAIAESKNHLTVIGFSITDGYLQRYEKEKGKNLCLQAQIVLKLSLFTEE